MNELQQPIPIRANFKDTPETREKVIGFLRLGATRKDAAQAAGITYECLRLWMRDDVAFFAYVTEAEGLCAAEMAAAIARASRVDWRAAETWLKRRRRKEWGDSLKIDLGDLTNEQLIALLEEEAGGGGDAQGAEYPAGAEGTD